MPCPKLVVGYAFATFLFLKFLLYGNIWRLQLEDIGVTFVHLSPSTSQLPSSQSIAPRVTLPHQAKSEPLFLFIELAVTCQPRLAFHGLGLQIGKVGPQLAVLAFGDVEVGVCLRLVHVVPLVQLHHEAALHNIEKTLLSVLSLCLDCRLHTV